MGSDFRKRARDRAKSLGKQKDYKLKEGPNGFRLAPVPPDKKGNNEGYVEYQVHKNLPNSKVWEACGYHPVTKKGECLCCDKYIPMLEKKGKEERAAKIAPTKMVGVKGWPVDEDGKFGPFTKWKIPQVKLQRMVLQIIGSEKRDYLSLKKGYNFTITRTGTGFNDTTYMGPEADEESSKVPSSLVEKADLTPFSKDKAFPKYDEERMRKALYGDDASEDDDEDDEDEDEEETPKKKGKSKSKKDEDEDDEEDIPLDDDDDDDEDEEEEKSKKSKKSKKKSKKDEDEDDDSDSNDDEDGESGDDDEDDDDDDEDEEDEDDDDEDSKSKSKSKSKSNKSVKKSKKKSKDEDDEDDDEDEEEDDD